jgi:hypothetical protein
MPFNQPVTVDWSEAPAGGTLHARVLDVGADSWMAAAVNATPVASLSGAFTFKATVSLDVTWTPGKVIVWYAADFTVVEMTEVEPYLTAERTRIGVDANVITWLGNAVQINGAGLPSVAVFYFANSQLSLIGGLNAANFFGNNGGPSEIVQDDVSGGVSGAGTPVTEESYSIYSTSAA